MPRIETGNSTTGQANTDEAFALNVFDDGGPNPFFISGVSGTIAASQNGDVFAMRLDPSAANGPAHITSIYGWYRAITAATVPNTFRALRMRRFSGTVASSGTAIATAGQYDPAGPTSEVNTANGGDARIAAATTITSPGTPDALEVAERINLTKYGLINDELRWQWNFSAASGGAPLQLALGNSLAIGTTAAWDAGLTWEFGILVKWYEGRRQG